MQLLLYIVSNGKDYMYIHHNMYVLISRGSLVHSSAPLSWDLRFK